MEYLLVVYFLMNDHWVRGDEIEGWGSIPYASREECVERRERAEQIYADLVHVKPNVYEKRYVCERRDAGAGD